MQVKTIAMMAVLGCTITMLTGCGVPQEEHDALVAQMNADHATAVETLEATIAEKETLLENEKSKVKKERIKLGEAERSVKTLKAKDIETSRALASSKSKVSKLERDLESSKSSTQSAKAEIAELEDELATLQDEHSALQTRFDQFELNMMQLDQELNPNGTRLQDAPMDDLAEAADINQMNADSAAKILEEMSEK